MNNKEIKIFEHGVYALDECEMLGYNMTVEAIFKCPVCHNMAVAKRYIAGPISLVRVECEHCGIDLNDTENDSYDINDEWGDKFDGEK